MARNTPDFDPDAFLNDFDPDAFLAGQTPATTQPPQPPGFLGNLGTAVGNTLDLAAVPDQLVGESIRAAREGLPFRLPEAARGLDINNRFISSTDQPASGLEEITGGIQGLTQGALAPLRGESALQTAAEEVRRPKTRASDIATQIVLAGGPGLVRGSASAAKNIVGKGKGFVRKVGDVLLGPGEKVATAAAKEAELPARAAIRAANQRGAKLGEMAAKEKRVREALVERAGKQIGKAEKAGGFEKRLLSEREKGMLDDPTAFAKTMDAIAQKTPQELKLQFTPQQRQTFRKLGEEALARKDLEGKLDKVRVSQAASNLGESLGLDFPAFGQARSKFRAQSEALEGLPAKGRIAASKVKQAVQKGLDDLAKVSGAGIGKIAAASKRDEIRGRIIKSLVAAGIFGGAGATVAAILK